MRCSILILAPLAASAVSPPKRSESAPLLRAAPGNAIPDQYIVALNNGSLDALTDARNHVKRGATIGFQRVFQGFAATLTPGELENVRKDPNVCLRLQALNSARLMTTLTKVDYVEENAELNALATQSDSPWNLARLSTENTLPSSGPYDYFFDNTGGEGTCAYIIDSGVDANHPEFGDRASLVLNLVDGNNEDSGFHGTFVAGIVASDTYGVAKKATILAVKVIDDTGVTTVGLVMQAMEEVLEHLGTQSCPNGVAINLSLAGARSDSLNTAVNNAANEGIFVVSGAGNNGADAEDYSPASATGSCTAGATDLQDRAWDKSNYGAVVNVWAPGADIRSTVPGGGTAQASGTSAAAPHVLGLGLYFMSLGREVSGLCKYIEEQSVRDVLEGLRGDSNNLLINNGY